MLDKIRDYIRPMQGALMLLMLLAGATVSGVLELWSAGLGVQFTTGVAGWFRAIPDSYYTLLGALAGVYTIARSVEKVTGSLPANRPAVDEPEGGA